MNSIQEGEQSKWKHLQCVCIRHIGLINVFVGVSERIKETEGEKSALALT